MPGLIGAGLSASWFCTQCASLPVHARSLSSDSSGGLQDGGGPSSSSPGPRDSPDAAAVATAGAGKQQETRSDPPHYVLLSGAASIPHPAKVDKGGEDSHFIDARGLSIGVADGVGGWAEMGIDPGLYSKQFMRHARAAAEESEIEASAATPRRIMQAAFNQTDVQGSSTACVICLSGSTLHGANLGDSGYMVVRGGTVVCRTPSQQHDFNFPYQLGSKDSLGDTPADADLSSFPVMPGDIIVAATDGLFDNVFDEDCARLVTMGKEKALTPEQTACAVARYAQIKATDTTYLSPFAEGALASGFQYMGGKLDDITVVVSFVAQNPQASPSSKL